MGNFLPTDCKNLVVDPVLLHYRKVTHAAVYESYDILKDAYAGKYSLSEDEFAEVFSHWMGESAFSCLLV